MQRTAAQLREDALCIWDAGVQAVKPGPLIFNAVQVDSDNLWIADERIDLGAVARIAVVGGGKAAAGMALAIEQALGPALCREKQLFGLVNVPDDCLLPTDFIELCPARPAGVNEPTEAGVAATRRMMTMVAGLGPRDLCLGVISGGGSALLALPRPGIQLHEKVAVTRAMSAQGATIGQLNLVRRELSHVKNGGLVDNCRAGRLASLIVSDVPGDDLSVVASGPTVKREARPLEALSVLDSFELSDREIMLNVRRRLQTRAAELAAPATSTEPQVANPPCPFTNVLVGNNAAAVDAAGVAAERIGYSHAMTSATAPEGLADDVGARLAGMARQMRTGSSGPDCLITGGETTVRLAPEATRGRGGRNQQLALAALAALDDWRGLCLLSGGTDGEDGPTDATGACVDEQVAAEASRLGLDPRDYLARNDAYTFFEKCGGLLKTGPTHTNVCDLRVITVSR